MILKIKLLIIYSLVNNVSTNTEIFKNLNLSSTTKNNTNAFGQGQAIFGEHKTFRSFGSLNANTSNQRQVLYFGTSNTITNNVSPFGVNP